MKRTGKRIASVLGAAFLSATALVGLAACDEDNVINAYDIAVQNGFQGTETEWLASLKGDDGEDGADFDIYDAYETAKEKENFQGSFSDFLKKYLNVQVSEDNETSAIAKATSSIVSICAGFTTTTTERKGLYGTTTTVVPSASAGSGVIYSINENAKTAYIITNYHVLYGKDTDAANDMSECIYVYPYGALNGFTTEYRTDGSTSGVGNGVLDSGEQMGDMYGGGIKARYVGGAMEYDIAVLETYSDDYFGSGTTAQAAEIIDSNSVTVGEKTFAIGNANGEGISSTSGVLSVESEYITMTSPDATRAIRYRVMRTDAAINHGNSGGGLFNANGKLIGITNAKNVEDETDNMGYALPITQVKYVVENILDNVKTDVSKRYVSRATLGIQTQITQSSGAIVDGKYVIKETFQVTTYEIPTTAAAYNKLKADDIIQTIKIGDGETVTLTRSFQLVDLCLTIRKGDTVVIGGKRGGADFTATIVFDKDSYFTTYA